MSFNEHPRRKDDNDCDDDDHESAHASQQTTGMENSTPIAFVK